MINWYLRYFVFCFCFRYSDDLFHKNQQPYQLINCWKKTSPIHIMLKNIAHVRIIREYRWFPYSVNLFTSFNCRKLNNNRWARSVHHLEASFLPSPLFSPPHHTLNLTFLSTKVPYSLTMIIKHAKIPTKRETSRLKIHKRRQRRQVSASLRE